MTGKDSKRVSSPTTSRDCGPDTSAADMLIKLLERQQALAEQLDGLTERQAAQIESGDSDALLALLAHRQRIMDQFIAGQDSLGRLSEACRREGAASEQTRQMITALIEDITKRLGHIMDRDEQDRDLLERHRQGVGESLAGLSTAREARQAYVAAQSMKNRFADRRG